MAPRQPSARLRAQLDGWMALYHRPEFLAEDPLLFAHRFGDHKDREVAALIAAAFASGNIKSILAFLERLFETLGPHPARFLAETTPSDLHGRFPGTYHRWVREGDVEIFLALIGAALRRHGSLGKLWRSVDDPNEDDSYAALGRFVESILAGDVAPLRSRERLARRADGREVPLARMETILLSPPQRGSACKRMHLFLRWVARPDDGIDLGLWTDFLSPSRLVIPVDTHVLAISQRLRLTARTTADRRAALEITARLRQLSPDDPIRYDFSFVRAGIHGS